MRKILIVFIALLIISTGFDLPKEFPDWDKSDILKHHIETITYYKYYNKWINSEHSDTMSIIKDRMFKYDKKGNLVQEYHHAEGHHEFYYLNVYHAYDSQGNLIRSYAEKASDSSIYYLKKYKYDEKNRVVKLEQFGAKWRKDTSSIINEIYTRYNQSETKKIKIDSSDAEGLKKTIEYYKNGILEQLKIVQGDNDLDVMDTIVFMYYYKKKKLIKSEFISTYGHFFEAYYYNKNGLLEKKTSKPDNGKYVISYDNLGRITHRKQFKSDTLVDEYTWDYDNRGMILQFSYNNFKKDSISPISYSADSLIVFPGVRNSYIDYEKKPEIYEVKYTYYKE